MQVDAITTHTDRIGKRLGSERVALLSREAASGIGSHVLFEHGELRPDTPGLPNIRILGQAVLCSHRIFPQSQSGPTLAAIRPRSSGLHPVKERKTELLGALQMAPSFAFTHLVEVAQPIIILRPVNQRDIAAVGSGSEVF